jgi:hypothetical protein
MRSHLPQIVLEALEGLLRALDGPELLDHIIAFRSRLEEHPHGELRLAGLSGPVAAARLSPGESRPLAEAPGAFDRIYVKLYVVPEPSSPRCPTQEVFMTGLTALWLPILLSAVIVFVASSIIHMASPWHKSDYPKVPNEDRVAEALRPFGLPPGDYMMPRASSMQEMSSPEFVEKMKQGPVMVFTVMPNGPMSMGRNLVLWFLYSAVVGLFAAYVAGRALAAGTPYLRVFQFVGATAFLGYAAALWQMSIWYHRAWITTIKATVDGLIYALLTAGTFGWLWPR